MTRRLALAASISLVCLSGLCATANATFPGSNGRLAFSRSEGAPSQIFTVDPGGLVASPLTGDAEHNNFAPAWSPDGSRLVFVQNTSMGNPPFTLELMNADGSGLRPLATDPSFLADPSWSPDGRHVVFQAETPSEGLYVVDVDSGAPPVAIPGTAGYFEPAWSPLGNRIAVAVDPDQVGTISTDGSDFQPLDTPPVNLTDRDPAWSADASTIYFDQGPALLGCASTTPPQIFMVPAGGGAVTSFSQDPSIREYDPAPSPDGTAVAFARCDDPTDSLDHVWVAAPNGSGAHALTGGGNTFDDDPDWQPTAPQFASAPSVSGGAVNNQTLTATAGSSPGGGSTGLQFERCSAQGTGCVAIPGASASRGRAAASSASYKLTTVDLGHTIRVHQTQTNGLGSTSADSPATSSVVPSRGHCSNRFAGTARADRIKGSAGSDRISGGRGKDRLSGLGGSDCISGGAGNDVLSGGKGNDTLSGGAGNDRITAGPGRNKVSGGAGNDRINVRNHKRDVVNCGKGKRDRVVADKRDKLRGCERVKRR
ncbi:MAG TPA: hypothetical protein VGF74_06970 [Thermoleophilaceae bacterium]